MLHQIKYFLSKPFPHEENYTKYLLIISLVSLFVTLFLYIFQPFGMSSVQRNRLLICIGYGAITFFSSIVYDFIVNRLLDIFGRNKHFTFGRWILDITALLLTISFFNFIYSKNLVNDLKWEHLPIMVFVTFAIGIFPAVLIGAISLLKQENKYKFIAQEINTKESTDHASTGLTDTKLFDIPVRQIRYIEALQNYVKIGFIDQDNQFKEKTERATLKSILEDSEGTHIVRCHRSFLINQSAIKSTTGNAQGLQATLENCNRIIPVSRSYVKNFR